MFSRFKKKISPPNHIAIIMDGNRRWAKKNKISKSLGHYEGAKNLRKIVEECLKINLKFLTVYAFSTENWSRSEEEVNDLMSLLNKFLSDESKLFNEKKIKLNILGDISRFPSDIQDKVTSLSNETKNNNSLTLNIALNYSSRDEIINAVNRIINDKNQSISKEVFIKYLYTADIPDPDLIIRTSGEYRLSNFLLWQAAYSELYFTKKLWQEFDVKELSNALIEYSRRERRFGTN